MNNHYNKRSPFDILGVGQYSSQKEIRRAYLDLCKKYHPDVLASCSTTATAGAVDFREITVAYELLSNSKKNNRIINSGGMDWEAVKKKNINTKVWTRNSYFIGLSMAALTILYLTSPSTGERNRRFISPTQHETIGGKKEDDDDIIVKTKAAPWQASDGISFREWRKRG